MKIVKVILATVCSFVIGINAKAQNGLSALCVFNFTNGSQPRGNSLISDGTYLYGMTPNGGATGDGVIFKMNTDGSAYTKLLDFDGTKGSFPYGSLISDGTYLYGMTNQGGANSKGVIFKIKPDGSAYTKLLDFNGTNGKNPFGSLISDGTYFYGMTQYGGANNYGVIFKIKPNGTDYDIILNLGTSGSSPYGDLIRDGNFLYGMTYFYGASTRGVIFKIKPDGTDYANLLDFDGMNGSNPVSTLISDGTYLYGTASQGGANNKGVIFKIKPDGTGYTKLFDFDGVNGASPQGSLLSDGTYLYGMTGYGGIDSGGTGGGVVYKIKPDGTGFTILIKCIEEVTGTNPFGSLISDGTYLYGMTNTGGSIAGTGYGVVFKLDKNTVAAGIDELGIENNELSIYPNPVNEILSAEIETPNANIEIKLFDALGKEMMNEQFEATNGTAQIDVRNLPKGIYFIRVGERIGRFVKE